jgi:hypothetical protein
MNIFPNNQGYNIPNEAFLTKSRKENTVDSPKNQRRISMSKGKESKQTNKNWLTELG